jgi:hypothetical protein
VIVALPVAIASALDTSVHFCTTFIVIGTIAIAISVNVPTLLLAIIIGAAPGVA